MAQAPHRHVQRASRGLLAVARGDGHAHRRLRDRLLAIIWVSILLDVICTLIVFFAERHTHGTQIHNVGEAFLFSTSQLTTASSVDSPASEVGKVLELFFDVYAITVVATLAGSFGAFFHKIGMDHDAQEKAADEAKAAAEVQSTAAGAS